MSRKWLNALTTEDATRINRVFNITRPIDNKTKVPLKDLIERTEELRIRTEVRKYLRKHKLAKVHIDHQYGRLAAGLPVLPLEKLKPFVDKVVAPINKKLKN